MKKILSTALSVVATVAAFASSPQVPVSPARFTGQADSVSYAIGVDLGVTLAKYNTDMFNSELDMEFVISAMRDVWAGTATMTRDEAHDLMKDFLAGMPARNLRAAEEFLARTAAENPDIHTTESGLLYRITNPGDETLRAVNDRDELVVSYIGTLPDGREFSRDDSVTLRLDRVIKGFAEGAKLIGKGGRIELWIHPGLAYGEEGAGDIPANSAIMFDFEIVDVILYVEPDNENAPRIRDLDGGVTYKKSRARSKSSRGRRAR